MGMCTYVRTYVLTALDHATYVASIEEYKMYIPALATVQTTHTLYKFPPAHTYTHTHTYVRTYVNLSLYACRRAQWVCTNHSSDVGHSPQKAVLLIWAFLEWGKPQLTENTTHQLLQQEREEDKFKHM